VATALQNAPVPITRGLVTVRLVALLKLITRSARLAFKRTTGLPGFDARLIIQVGTHGPLTLAQIVALLGQDKGQVSRAVKRLVGARVLSREHLRAAIEMTPAGKAAYGRILRLAKSRNAALIDGLTDQELEFLPLVTGRLQANAQSMLAEEQARQRAADEPVETPAPPARARRERAPRDVRDRLVIPDLIGLQNVVLRSAALAFQRELGLSEVDWQLMSQVGEHAPLTLIQLVPLMSQDKSQVARALTRAEAMGLITRQKIGGGRHVMISGTDKGRATYNRLVQLALQRNAVLIAGLSQPEQQQLSITLEKLTTNAAALLAREQDLTSP
jgi:DNA-binding MarR family transcriptional regulator